MFFLCFLGDYSIVGIVKVIGNWNHSWIRHRSDQDETVEYYIRIDAGGSVGAVRAAWTGGGNG